ncbi:DUF3460 family protein [Oxalobacter sp. OttesenSCG-928-P03]|nr:DUF3460 family protein [Oxalobacter sp. OttesenSCG-928-P03]
MKFFWRQPTYQSDLDNLLEQLSRDNPALPVEKEAGLKRLWDKAPFSPDDAIRNKQSLLPQPANPYL